MIDNEIYEIYLDSLDMYKKLTEEILHTDKSKPVKKHLIEELLGAREKYAELMNSIVNYYTNNLLVD